MSVEKKIKAASGWGMLGVILIAFIAIVAVFVLSIIGLVNADEAGVAASPLSGWGLGLSITAFCLIWIPVSGFFTLQPGQARVCILFGDYKGTVRSEGFHWVNPFYSRSMGGSDSGLRVELDAGDRPRGVARVPQQRDRPAAGAEVRAALPLFRRGEMREQNRVGREAVRAAHQHAAVRRERLPVFVFPHGVPSCIQNVVAGGEAAPPV